MDSYTEEEYEIQYFGFSADQMKRELSELITNHIQLLSSELAENIIQTSEIDKQSATRLRAKVSLISDNIIAKSASGKAEKQLNSLVQNTFKIPANLTLPNDLNKLNIINENELALNMKLLEMENDMKQNIQMLSALEVELNLHKKLLPNLQQHIEILENVDAALCTPNNLYEQKSQLAKLSSLY